MESWRVNIGSRRLGDPGHGARNQNETIALIVNPRARGGEAGRQLDELRRAVDRAFGQWTILLTAAPGHASVLAREALDTGVDIVAAVGGDGTCSEVVAGMFEGPRPYKRKAVFTVIPWGTGSDLARSLRAPQGLADALWVAATGMTLFTDVGWLSWPDDPSRADRAFINVCGFGANGEVVERANASSKRWGGRLSFLRATAGALWSYRPEVASLEWDGPDGAGAWEGRVLSAFVANGAWCGGGMWVGRGGTMHDGHLDLIWLDDRAVGGFVREGWRLYDGSVWRARGAHRARVTRVVARGALKLDVDGEQVGRLPVEVSVVPGLFQVRGGWVASPLLDSGREIWTPESG